MKIKKDVIFKKLNFQDIFNIFSRFFPSTKGVAITDNVFEVNLVHRVK